MAPAVACSPADSGLTQLVAELIEDSAPWFGAISDEMAEHAGPFMRGGGLSSRSP